MPDPRDLLLTSWRDNLTMADRLLGDVPPGRIAEQAGGVVNHPAWTLGHLIHYHPAILAAIRGEAIDNPASRDGAQWYDEGSEPHADPSLYPSKAELMRGFRDGHEAVEAVLCEVPSERLDEPPGLERWAQGFGNTGRLLTYLMGTHEAFHLGELAVWRRAVGLPRVGS